MRDGKWPEQQRPGYGSRPASLHRFCARDHAPVGGAFRGVTDDALARLSRSRRIVDGLHTRELIAVAPQKLLNGPTGLAVFEPPTDHLLDWRSRAAASGGCGNRFLPPSSDGWRI
jgi:hypothetical protein